ncbi:MAG: sigma factor [Rhodothermales bacterium]
MDNRTELIVRLWNDSRRYFRACAERERLLGMQDVEDLASDVMVAVIPRLDGLHAPDRYVRRMARNRVIRELRRRRAEQGVLFPMDPSADAVTDASDAFDDQAERVVRTARRLLREEDTITRMMVAARCASPSRSFSEISQVTGVSSSALRMRMSRFTRRVRSAVENPAPRVVVHRTKTRKYAHVR